MPVKKKSDSNKSYSSLLYGVLTLVAVAILGFVGFKLYPELGKFTKTDIAKDGVATEESEKKEEKTTQKTYEVKAGDSLWTIAEKRYGSGYNWVDIARENKLSNPDIVNSGTKLVLPDVQAKIPTREVIGIASSNQKIEGDKYTVQKSDNLWEIAVRAYGDGFKWVSIAKANNLANPSLLHSGNILAIPRDG